jgi:hypothetical protein
MYSVNSLDEVRSYAGIFLACAAAAEAYGSARLSGHPVITLVVAVSWQRFIGTAVGAVVGVL